MLISHEGSVIQWKIELIWLRFKHRKHKKNSHLELLIQTGTQCKVSSPFLAQNISVQNSQIGFNVKQIEILVGEILDRKMQEYFYRINDT